MRPALGVMWAACPIQCAYSASVAISGRPSRSLLPARWAATLWGPDRWISIISAAVSESSQDFRIGSHSLRMASSGSSVNVASTKRTARRPRVRTGSSSTILAGAGAGFGAGAGAGVTPSRAGCAAWDGVTGAAAREATPSKASSNSAPCGVGMPENDRAIHFVPSQTF